MTALTISKNIQPVLQTRQFARNGKPVVVEYQNALASALDHFALVRPRFIFHRVSPFTGAAGGANIPASNSTTAARPRWRFAWRSGPFARFLVVQMELAPQNYGDAGDPYGLLQVRNSAGTIIGDAEIHWGNSDGSFTDVPSNFGGGAQVLTDPNTQDTTVVEIEPDTDYWGLISDVGYGRVISAEVSEASLSPDTDNGYAWNYNATGTPIYYQQREDIALMGRTCWRKGGRQLINYTSDTDATVTGSSGAEATFKNVISGATSVTAATPGWKLDMTYRTTLGRAALGVPVVMKVTALSTAGNTARIRLVDSAGATMLEQTCDQAGEFNYTTTGYIPADEDKYDIHWGGSSDAFYVRAVSIYEYDAAGETVSGAAAISRTFFSVAATGTVA